MALDKIIHFLAGFGIAAILLPFFGFWALLAAVIAGALKEWRDSIAYGGPDFADFLATVYGGVAATVAYHSIAYLMLP